MDYLYSILFLVYNNVIIMMLLLLNKVAVMELENKEYNINAEA
jgi:hypothetical protein